MRRSARSAATRLLAENVATLERIGYAAVERPGSLRVRLESAGRVPLAVEMIGRGRVFGGSYALSVATAEPVLPSTAGLSARGKGIVRLARVAFRARRSDEAGAVLARRLNADEGVQGALAGLHFEALSVEPDGRAVVRHLGGSVVWILFPPLVRPVPLVPEQARATVGALEELARAGAERA
jgi:uncharacterized protein DUF3156